MCCPTQCNGGAFEDGLRPSWSVLMTHAMTQTEIPQFQFVPQSEIHTGRVSISPFRNCHYPYPLTGGVVWEWCLNTGLECTISRQAILYFTDPS